MAALRLLTAFPVRFFSILTVLSTCFFFVLLYSPLSFLKPKKSPVYLYPALSVSGLMPSEAMSSHMFPYDLLYICPALRPRLRCSNSLIVRSRSLPLSVKWKPHAISTISRLNDTAFVLAVYASRALSPRPMQDSLPATCYALPDEMHNFLWFPLGHSKRFLPISSFYELHVANWHNII